LRVRRARRIAERAHRGSIEASGDPVIAHVGRVAEASPVFARAVAWLHEVLENSSVTEEELLGGGLGITDEELRALRLLTRFSDSRSEDEYFAHIGHIARASGPAGEIARTVKRRDLADRLGHPNLRPDGWHPPYRAALALLDEPAAQTQSPDAFSLGEKRVSRAAGRRIGTQT
jgi:hypothetical protein